MNNTEITTNFSFMAVSEELPTASTITALTDLTHTIDQTNPTSSSSHGESDVLRDVLDQTTQPPTTPTEMSTEDDTVSTDHEVEVGDNSKKHTTIIPSLDSTGSGMGETTYTTTSEADPADSMETSEDHGKEDYSLNPTGKEPEAKEMSLAFHCKICSLALEKKLFIVWYIYIYMKL